MTNTLRYIPPHLPAAQRQLRARGRATMRSLMDAGLEAFAEQGWHDASIDRIVARAHASHGTFYQYFGAKADLLLTLAHECASVMVELVGDLGPISGDDDGRAAIRAWLERFLDAYGTYRGVVRAWMENQVDHPELEELGQSVITAYVARFAELIGDDGLRAMALLAMLERLSYGLASRGVDVERGRVLDTLTLMIHQGFFTPTGRAAPSF